MIDLNKFCANENDPREYLRNPLTALNQDFATNGHILVRLDGVSKNPNHAKEKTFVSVLQSIDAQNILDYTPLTVVLPNKSICSICDNKGFTLGREKKECPECDGEGEFTHGNHEYECKECDGDGEVESFTKSDVKVPCYRCPTQPVPVGDLNFQRKYLAMLLELPNIQYLLDSGKGMMFFKFDGGDGCLMRIYP